MLCHVRPWPITTKQLGFPCGKPNPGLCFGSSSSSRSRKQPQPSPRAAASSISLTSKKGCRGSMSNRVVTFWAGGGLSDSNDCAWQGALLADKSRKRPVAGVARRKGGVFLNFEGILGSGDVPTGLPIFPATSLPAQQASAFFRQLVRLEGCALQVNHLAIPSCSK